MTVLDLRRDWILPGQPDAFGIDARLAERKQARLNGVTLVRSHERRGERARETFHA